MEISANTKERQRKAAKRREHFLALVLISPYFIVFLLFTVIPFIMGFVFSFMQYNPYMPEQNEFIGFDNFARIFDFGDPISQKFWSSFSTMLVFSAVNVPLAILVPLGLAYLLNMHPPGYKVFRAILYLPCIISITIVGIIFGNMFAGSSSGLINAWLGTEIKWLSGRPWENDFLRWFVIVLANVWMCGGNFVILAAALRSVPKSLNEACEMDGGGRWERFLYVTLPGIKPAVSICLFNSLIANLNLYGGPYVLNEIDNESLLVTPMMFIQNFLLGGAAYARQTGFLCAAAIVFGAVVMLLSMIERRAMDAKKRRTNYSEEYALIKGENSLAEGEKENDEKEA